MQIQMRVLIRGLFIMSFLAGTLWSQTTAEELAKR